MKKPPWRTISSLLILVCILELSYYFWSPGKNFRDGRHDLRSNGIWIQHGWLGDDNWFQQYKKNRSFFRTSKQISELSLLLKSHGIKYIFPHACPCKPNGEISQIDPVQTELFLDQFEGFKVLPWIGGVLDYQCFLEDVNWRKNFVTSVVLLFEKHPRFSGIHINIEPLPSGNLDFLLLLKELKIAIPTGKILSIAAYPPPTLWHNFSDVHWDESYFKSVSRLVDQIVPMMYDTSIKYSKLYESLLSKWTLEVLGWSEGAEVLLGIPVYDDKGVRYHYSNVENLENSLSGIHSGLSKQNKLSPNYAGVSIYCEWEMDKEEWSYFSKEFEKK